MRHQQLLLSCLIFSFNTNGQVVQEDILIRNDSAFKNNDTYTGTYLEYYPGDVRVRGNYFNGLRHGSFTYYNQWPFRDPTGYCQQRRPDSVVHYVMGKRNGIKEIYHDMRKKEPLIWSIETYKNDLLDGECNYWHESGQLESTVIYEMGKRVKEVTYPIDKSIVLLDFHFANFAEDTIHVSQLKPVDSLRPEIFGYKESGNSLAMVSLRDKGFTVKSYVVVIAASNVYREIPFESESFDEHLMSVVRKKFMERFFIEKLILVDRHGKQYRMPMKTFQIRD